MKDKYPMKIICEYHVELIKGKPKIVGSGTHYTKNGERLNITDYKFSKLKLLKDWYERISK